MMKRRSLLIFLFIMSVMAVDSAFGAYVVKNGKLTNVKTLATLSAQGHYDLGMQAIQDSNWEEAQKQLGILTDNFPRTELAQGSYFYLGIAEYKQDELDFANEAFSNYLKSKNNPKFFQDAIIYKYEIAGKLANGSKRRFLGSKSFPKWATGDSLALTVYDEVIAALPSNDLAARALYSKGGLHWKMKDYRLAIENYQLVIRRFPKHELVPECYQSISKVFVEQSQYELQNPDILTFAEINLRKFKQEYPRDEGVLEVEKDLANLKEIYANGLYETGRFYERVGKPHASAIYYQSAIKKFPDTDISQQASIKLDAIKPNVKK
jgi:outer membrane protein assembly factor BamD (BamD/ComL family)